MKKTLNTPVKHSPAPWKVFPNEDGGYAKTSDSKFRIDSEDGMTVAVSVCDCVPQHEANARLIAAAPELLEALKLVQQWDGESSGALSDWAAMRDCVESAIAKATGEVLTPETNLADHV